MSPSSGEPTQLDPIGRAILTLLLFLLCPETQAGSFYVAHLSRFHLKTETRSILDFMSKSSLVILVSKF
jgi:hypothetical protein